MKKRLIASLVATAILIPTAAFAAPALIDMFTRTPMTADQVKVDKLGRATLEKLYNALPETRSFEIIDASYLGDPNDPTRTTIQQSIVLQEKGGTEKRITLHANGITGEVEDLTQENWEPKQKPLHTLTEQEIKAKVDYIIDKMYSNIKDFEVTLEQMDNQHEKTWMLNYTKKGSETPIYQVFVYGNAISLSHIGGSKSTPPSITVEGLFSLNGKPDYTADSFLNDEKLFALLQISPTVLKQELAKGRSVVEIAASKNVTKQQVIDVIARTQAENQYKADSNGEKASESLIKQFMKAVEPKVLAVIEHKTETEW